MKGKIDNKGFLHILRGNEYKEANCPNTYTYSDIKEAAGVIDCGDWCARFGEPKPELNIKPDGPGGLRLETSSRINLDICQGKTLIFNEFVDERVEEGDDV